MGVAIKATKKGAFSGLGIIEQAFSQADILDPEEGRSKEGVNIWVGQVCRRKRIGDVD